MLPRPADQEVNCFPSPREPRSSPRHRPRAKPVRETPAAIAGVIVSVLCMFTKLDQSDRPLDQVGCAFVRARPACRIREPVRKAVLCAPESRPLRPSSADAPPVLCNEHPMVVAGACRRVYRRGGRLPDRRKGRGNFLHHTGTKPIPAARQIKLQNEG